MGEGGAWVLPFAQVLLDGLSLMAGKCGVHFVKKLQLSSIFDWFLPHFLFLDLTLLLCPMERPLHIRW